MKYPKNQRGLTYKEKAKFLKKLSTLCLEYGVEFDIDTTYQGFAGSTPRLHIIDAHGHVLHDGIDFGQFDAMKYLGQ